MAQELLVGQSLLVIELHDHPQIQNTW